MCAQLGTQWGKDLLGGLLLCPPPLCPKPADRGPSGLRRLQEKVVLTDWPRNSLWVGCSDGRYRWGFGGSPKALGGSSSMPQAPVWPLCPGFWGVQGPPSVKILGLLRPAALLSLNLKWPYILFCRVYILFPGNKSLCLSIVVSVACSYLNILSLCFAIFLLLLSLGQSICSSAVPIGCLRFLYGWFPYLSSCMGNFLLQFQRSSCQWQ